MAEKPARYVPFSFPHVRFPFSLMGFGEEEEGMLQHFSDASGLSVSEDEKNVYIEASVPGIKAEDIEMSFEKGVLWIRGEKKEETEDKKKKYYRKATSSFSYRIAVPGNVEEGKHPAAVCKNGVLKVTFAKRKGKEVKTKKIPIKNG
ncbi:MAG: Hsp20/alpha crystallin family protein [Verrucomicrobia bacterium]|nr:Hsp20/alpha crystallin family protein [Verrucomicrobiota bacterium]